MVKTSAIISRSGKVLQDSNQCSKSHNIVAFMGVPQHATRRKRTYLLYSVTLCRFFRTIIVPYKVGFTYSLGGELATKSAEHTADL